MEHHYILQTTMRIRDNEFLSPLGLVCAEGELNDRLKLAKVVRYKIKKIDDDPVAGWEGADWTPIV